MVVVWLLLLLLVVVVGCSGGSLSQLGAKTIWVDRPPVRRCATGGIVSLYKLAVKGVGTGQVGNGATHN